jgi:MraZ protein
VLLLDRMGGFGAKWGEVGRILASKMSFQPKPYYTGAFRHTLDDKNRLTIPSAWRTVHSETDLFLIVPLAGYLSVLPPADAQKLYDRISAQSLSDTDLQNNAAYFFSKTLSFTFDKSGRVMLTPELCAHAGIVKDVQLVGSMNKFNLYSPEKWARLQTVSEAQNDSDRLLRMGI